MPDTLIAAIPIAEVPPDGDMKQTYKKIILRLVPLLFVCYFFNYLDRVNVGFAKLQMLGDLYLSEVAYGIGAGIFFVGYIACEVPSNLILYKIGARRWLAICMVFWGIFSAGLTFVNSANEFYILRLLTGVAEAGFFPGVILYFTYWFPAEKRGRVTALFMSAIPISGLLGSPFSGWILEFFSNSAHGMAGWRWMYLLQGVPTIPLGIALFFFLNDSVDEAKWLSPSERTSLKSVLAEDGKDRPAEVVSSFGRILLSPAVWKLSFIYFCIEAGVYSINFWLPTIIKQSGVSSVMAIGWLSAVPYLAAFVFMIIVGHSADAWKERRWHLNVPMAMGVIGLVLAAAFASNTIVAMVGLTLACMGALAALAMFWPMGSSFLTASAAAGGVALINSLGQFAGLLSPYLIGWIEQTTQSTYLALYLLAGLLLVGALLVLWVPARVVNR